MSSGPGVLRQLWLRWKTLKLPWRRQFLVGADLAGNTFWEFKDALNANRLRRIVKNSRKTHYADVKITPQWYQWLRHTRDEAPSIQEQQYEVSRQEMMKQRALEADERWNSQPSYLDSPARQQPAPAVAAGESAAPPTPNQVEQEGVKSGVGDPQEVGEVSHGKEVRSKGEAKPKGRNPWDTAQRGAPSENWTPSVAQRR